MVGLYNDFFGNVFGQQSVLSVKMIVDGVDKILIRVILMVIGEEPNIMNSNDLHPQSVGLSLKIPTDTIEPPEGRHRIAVASATR